MFSNCLHRLAISSPAGRWSRLAAALALLGMLLSLTGWPVSASVQNRSVAGSFSDEGESEFPGEDEGDDAADGDLEAHLPFRRSTRETLLPGIVPDNSAPLMVESDRACSASALDRDRSAAACSAAKLPLRC